MSENRVTLSANTKCYRCGGSLLEGQVVRWNFDTEINGYVHRHSRSGLCHRRNREVDHSLVMEVIENERNAIPEAAR